MDSIFSLTADHVINGWLKTTSGGFIRMQDISAFEVNYNDASRYQQAKGYIPSVTINAVLKSTIGSDYEDGVCSAEYSVAYYPLPERYVKVVNDDCNSPNYGHEEVVERNGFDNAVKNLKDYATQELRRFIEETRL